MEVETGKEMTNVKNGMFVRAMMKLLLRNLHKFVVVFKNINAFSFQFNLICNV